MADIMMLLNILLMLCIAHIRPSRRSLCFVVIFEQLLIHLMYEKYGPGEYLCLMYAMLSIIFYQIVIMINNDLSTKIVALTYFFVGGYHFLLFLEISLDIANKVTPFLYVAHQSINISANIVIMISVVFGGICFDRINLPSFSNFFMFLVGGHWHIKNNVN